MFTLFRGDDGQSPTRVLLEEDEREMTTAIGLRLLDRKRQTRFQFSFVVTAGMVNRERRVVLRKVPQHTPFHIFLVSSKILVLAESFLKCDNEPSTEAYQDAVFHACVGVEVIPQGPLEGDHTANGRVEMAVREVKRQCRTLRIPSEHDTGVRIADDSQLLSWLPRFAAQVMN